MKKEFYIGQPLIVKETGEKVVLHLKDSGGYLSYYVIGDEGLSYANYGDLEPSTEFKFSQIIAGLEQGYFEVGTEFRTLSNDRVIKVEQGSNGHYLRGLFGRVFLTSRDINSTWVILEPRKEITLEEIEAELGYKIKLTDNV